MKSACEKIIGVPKTPRDIMGVLTKPGKREPRHYWPIIGRRWMDRDAGGGRRRVNRGSTGNKGGREELQPVNNK